MSTIIDREVEVVVVRGIRKDIPNVYRRTEEKTSASDRGRTEDVPGKFILSSEYIHFFSNPMAVDSRVSSGGAGASKIFS